MDVLGVNYTLNVAEVTPTVPERDVIEKVSIRP